jgi:hypothetical protein
VHVVHDAVQTLSHGRRRKLLALVPLISCLALLGSCGGSSHSTSTAGPGVGSSLRLANCIDWNHATEARRRDTVAALRAFAGGPVGSSAGIQHGPVLPDARAYKLFQSFCSHFYARGFKLYKLYTHAAAFIGQPSG